MGDVVPEIVLATKRAQRRISEFNDTIDHFTEFSRDALHSANENEAAKYRYIDALPLDVRRELEL